MYNRSLERIPLGLGQQPAVFLVDWDASFLGGKLLSKGQDISWARAVHTFSEHHEKQMFCIIWYKHITVSQNVCLNSWYFKAFHSTYLHDQRLSGPWSWLVSHCWFNFIINLVCCKPLFDYCLPSSDEKVRGWNKFTLWLSPFVVLASPTCAKQGCGLYCPEKSKLCSWTEIAISGKGYRASLFSGRNSTCWEAVICFHGLVVRKFSFRKVYS